MTARPSDDVIESIHAIMHLYRSRQYRALRGGPHDITHMENKALGFLRGIPARPRATSSRIRGATRRSSRA